MCSIFGIFGLQPGDDVQVLRRQSLERSGRLRHRGPDWSGVYVDEGAILVHERLAIVDPAGGSQPLLSEDGQQALAVNGEIYNHKALKAELTQAYVFQTESDCEVINALYRVDSPASYLNRLNGIFAFALWDKAQQRAIIARDPMGVVPLYWGHDAQGRLRVASEMKALSDDCADVAQFPPGHWFDTATGELTQYYQRPWRDYAAVFKLRRAGFCRRARTRGVHRRPVDRLPVSQLVRCPPPRQLRGSTRSTGCRRSPRRHRRGHRDHRERHLGARHPDRELTMAPRTERRSGPVYPGIMERPLTGWI